MKLIFQKEIRLIFSSYVNALGNLVSCFTTAVGAAEQKLTRNSYYFACSSDSRSYSSPGNVISNPRGRRQGGQTEALTKCKSIQERLKHQVNPLMLKKRPATAYVVNILNMITENTESLPKTTKKRKNQRKNHLIFWFSIKK